MKFLSAAIVLSSVAVSAATSALPALLKAARRLEDGAADGEFTFLQSYTVKMLRCSAGETYISPVDGSYEYNSVVFRLCASECSSDSAYGCDTAYGDYVVGLNTFASLYLEQKRDDMQGDDDANDWKFEEFGVCQAWEVDRDVEVEEGLAFYVGPECTDDSTSVKLAMFTDATCQTESETYSFEDISNGVSLPYSSGGLIGTGCESCYGANDRGEYELSEMCTSLYSYSGKCETNMESYHANGKNEESCELIMSLMPASIRASRNGGAMFGWIVFAVVIVGAIGYGYMTMKKKQDDKRTGLMS